MRQKRKRGRREVKSEERLNIQYSTEEASRKKLEFQMAEIHNKKNLLIYVFFQSSLRDLNYAVVVIPGDKSPGYYRPSLRD